MEEDFDFSNGDSWGGWGGGSNEWGDAGWDGGGGGGWGDYSAGNYTTDAINYDPYGGAYAEAGDFNEARVTVDGNPLPSVVDRNVQTFDDGTRLTTLSMSDGTTSAYSSETNTQVFDDGSKLVTERQDWGYGQTYTDTSSVDSLDSRLSGDGLRLIDPRTTSPADIGTAQDVMDNYRGDLTPSQLDNLNTFINDYYLNQNSLFPDAGPTPTFGPPQNFEDA